MKKYRIAYLCNGNKPECCKDSNCYLNGGECNHTTDLNYSDSRVRNLKTDFDKLSNGDLIERKRRKNNESS